MQHHTTLTHKQQAILKLLYDYRFLHRIHIQYFLNHKDYKRINIWLKDLYEQHYIERIYENTFVGRTKPAIYYLGIEGIRYLRSLGRYPDTELHKRYREAKRSQSYIDSCLLIADCVRNLQETANPDVGHYSETEAQYRMRRSRYHFFAEETSLRPAICMGTFYLSAIDFAMPVPIPVFAVDIIEPNLPQYRLRKRIKEYLEFYRDNEWACEMTKDGRCVMMLCVCPRLSDLIYAKRTARRLLADDWDFTGEKGPTILFTTTEKIKVQGMFGSSIWERAEAPLLD